MNAIAPGQRFGRWTVIEKTNERRNGQIMCLCRCDCGQESLIRSYSLKSGKSLSCGCLLIEKRRERRIDLTGHKYGRLTVIALLPNRYLLCQCECGKRISVFSQNLRRGRTKSCGCLRAELEPIINEKMKQGKKMKQSVKLDGRNIGNIKEGRKLNINSTTGVLGVSMLNGKYRAHITYNGEHLYLGSYDTLDDAIDVRKEAEKQLFGPIIKEWEKENNLKISADEYEEDSIKNEDQLVRHKEAARKAAVFIKKVEVRGKLKTILDIWKESGLIDGYTENLRNMETYGVTIRLDPNKC